LSDNEFPSWLEHQDRDAYTRELDHLYAFPGQGRAIELAKIQADFIERANNRRAAAAHRQAEIAARESQRIADIEASQIRLAERDAAEQAERELRARNPVADALMKIVHALQAVPDRTGALGPRVIEASAAVRALMVPLNQQ
jgi:hypothetical protein